MNEFDISISEIKYGTNEYKSWVVSIAFFAIYDLRESVKPNKVGKNCFTIYLSKSWMWNRRPTLIVLHALN